MAGKIVKSYGGQIVRDADGNQHCLDGGCVIAFDSEDEAKWFVDKGLGEFSDGPVTPTPKTPKPERADLHEKLSKAEQAVAPPQKGR